jgi:hypothetical protein
MSQMAYTGVAFNACEHTMHEFTRMDDSLCLILGCWRMRYNRGSQRSGGWEGLVSTLNIQMHTCLTSSIAHIGFLNY